MLPWNCTCCRCACRCQHPIGHSNRTRAAQVPRNAVKLNATAGKPPLPPRHTQPQPQQQQHPQSNEQQELSNFAPRTRETRLSNAALSRQRLKMSLKRGGPPPAASSGAAKMMTTSLSATSLDQQVRLKQRSAHRGYMCGWL